MFSYNETITIELARLFNIFLTLKVILNSNCVEPFSHSGYFIAGMENVVSVN